MHTCRPPKLIILDMDSSESPTYGNQEGSAYNGHFGCPCYRPLFVFNRFGDVGRCALRLGNVHSAHEWRDLLEPLVARYRHKALRRYFRGDASTDMTPHVIDALGLNRRAPGPRHLPNGRLVAPDCALARSQKHHPKPPIRVE